jgi:hypothetical protein
VKATKLKSLLIAAITGTFIKAALVLNAGTLFTTPIIVVTPKAIDFGSVPLKTTVTNTVLLENWGGGKLVGKATVAPPFKILSGAAYRLGPSDVQVVTICYTPTAATNDTNVIKFTGGAGAIVPVWGKAISRSSENR